MSLIISKQDYLTRLQDVIEQLHRCGATHMKTALVHELLEGQTVWHGEVEVFNLHNHAKAERCYAWSHQEGNSEKFMTALEIQPVTSPQTAIRHTMPSPKKMLKKSGGGGGD